MKKLYLLGILLIALLSFNIVSASENISEIGTDGYIIAEPDIVNSIEIPSNDNVDELNENNEILTDNYQIKMEVKNNECYYGQDCHVSFNFSESLHKNIKVILNDNDEYNLYYDDEIQKWNNELVFHADNMNYGLNNVTIIYPGDNVNPAKTFHEIINCTGKILLPDSLVYNGDESISLILPKDANGTLIIEWMGSNYTILLKDGEAIYQIPKSFREIWMNQGISASYKGDDKYKVESESKSYEIEPKVIVPKIISETGGNITVDIDDGIIHIHDKPYDPNKDWESQGKSYKIKNHPTKIPIYPPEGNRTYKFYITLDIPYSGITYQYEIKVTNKTPNWDMQIESNDVLKYPNQRIIGITNYNSDIENNFALTIDNKNWDFKYFSNGIYIDTTKLTYGLHDFNLTFLGDEYFNPNSKIGSFNVSDMIMIIPKTSNTLTDNEIQLILPGNSNGTLTAKVNGKNIFNEKIKSTDYDRKVTINVTLNNLKYGISKVEATYNTTSQLFRKTGEITIKAIPQYIVKILIKNMVKR